jgi:hypothetical protein
MNEGTSEPFFESASAGRRWRTSPTDLLSHLVTTRHPQAAAYGAALVGVVEAAARLGNPGPHVGERAALTASVFQAAAASPGWDQAPPVTSAPSTLGAPHPRSPVAAAPADGTATSSAAPATQARTMLAAEGNSEQDPPRPLEELLAEVDALIGLERVKTEVHRQTALLRVEQLREEAGLATPTLTRHLVFVGNPGTGKTTLARLIAQIYRSLGLLESGHLVEVDRSGLVAGYVGQTAIKTAEAIDKAIGGVLFIDEAYALTSTGAFGQPDQFGMEAVNTLVKGMEDHRDDLVVIVAGYPGPMADFIDANPGLKSRFATTIHFEDYIDSQLRDIFSQMLDKADFAAAPGTLERMEHLARAQARDTGFGNARWARNMLDAAIARHAWRLRDVPHPTLAELRTLLPSDLDDSPPEPVAWPEPHTAAGAPTSPPPPPTTPQDASP